MTPRTFNDIGSQESTESGRTPRRTRRLSTSTTSAHRRALKVTAIVAADGSLEPSTTSAHRRALKGEPDRFARCPAILQRHRLTGEH